VLTLSVEERAAEIALMRLLGARRKLMARVVGYELGLFVAVGVPIGYALGYQLPFLLLKELLRNADTTLIVLTTVQQVIIAICLLAMFSVRPMLRAFRAMPIDAVRVTNPLEVYVQRPRSGIDRRHLAASLAVFIAVAYSTLFIPLLLFLSINTFILFLFVSVLVMLISLCVVLLGAVGILQEGFVAALAPLTGEVNKLTRRNLRRYVRRNISTNIIFGTVVAMLIFSNTLIAGVQASGPAAVRFISGADIRVDSLIPFSDSEVASVRSVAGVRDLAGATAGVGASAGSLSGAYSRDVTMIAVEGPLSGVTYVADSDVSAGDRQKLNSLGEREIVVSRAVANDLRVELGGTVAVRAGAYKEHVKVALVMKSIPGFPNLFDESSDFQQGMLVSASLYENATGKPAAPSVLFVDLDYITNQGRVVKDIRTALVSHFALSITSTERELAALKSTSDLLGLASLGVFSLLSTVAVFALTTNLYASVLEREFETGVLKVLGLRKRTILGSFVLEGATIAFTSVTLGVISGLVVGATFIFWLNVVSPFDIVVALEPGALLFVYASSLFFGILSAFFAARWSVRKQPVEQLVRRY
jgi:putative ABC transport system permease protein